jgi:hypothetical protein
VEADDTEEDKVGGFAVAVDDGGDGDENSAEAPLLGLAAGWPWFLFGAHCATAAYQPSTLRTLSDMMTSR